MCRKVILIGGGGHALSILEMTASHLLFAGYADLHPSEELPLQYLGTDEEVMAAYSNAEYDIHVSFVYAREVNLQMRARIIERYSSYQAQTLKASSSIVTFNSIVGEGCALMERTVVNHATLGKHVVVNTGAIIEHNCKIGNNVFIGPGTIICGGVTIGDNTFIGAGSVVRDEVCIAPNTVIGMGAIVTKNIINDGMYVGNPAKHA